MKVTVVIKEPGQVSVWATEEAARAYAERLQEDGEFASVTPEVEVQGGAAGKLPINWGAKANREWSA